MVDQIESNVEVLKTPKKRGRKPKNVLNAEPVEKIPKKGLGITINDRLIRAAK